MRALRHSTWLSAKGGGPPGKLELRGHQRMKFHIETWGRDHAGRKQGSSGALGAGSPQGANQDWGSASA